MCFLSLLSITILCIVVIELLYIILLSLPISIGIYTKENTYDSQEWESSIRRSKNFLKFIIIEDSLWKVIEEEHDHYHLIDLSRKRTEVVYKYELCNLGNKIGYTSNASYLYDLNIEQLIFDNIL